MSCRSYHARQARPKRRLGCKKATRDSKVPVAPEKVDAARVAEDVDISDRLVAIYQATGWFQEINAPVRDGELFLTGTTIQDKYRD